MTNPQTIAVTDDQGLLGKQVSFLLKYSSLASDWNRVLHEKPQTGRVLLAHDQHVVVGVPGWKWAHIVRVDRVNAGEQS